MRFVGKSIFDRFLFDKDLPAGVTLILLMKELILIWEKYCEASWPTEIGPHEGELMTLDTVITGCVRDYLADTKLHFNRIEILKNCMNELDILLPDLQGEVSIFFNRLQELGQMLLKGNGI